MPHFVFDKIIKAELLKIISNSLEIVKYNIMFVGLPVFELMTHHIL